MQYEHTFAYTYLMFEELKRTLREDPVDQLTRSLLDDRYIEARKLRGAIDAYEARLVRATDGLNDNGLNGEGTLRSKGRTSKKRAARKARTAKKLEELPETQVALEEGRITDEHADAVAEAAEETSPEEAEAELLERAEEVPADIFAKSSREWSGKKTKDDGAKKYERQRRNRSMKHWIDDNGMYMFLAALDRATGEEVLKAFNKRERQMWSDDGGRKGSPADMRTSEQRMADAFAELVQGSSSTGPSHPKNQVGVVFDVNGMADADGRPLASLVSDGQPLPQAVLDRILCTADIAPMVFNGPGRPIWVGRDYRHATVAQWRALIARDRGCVGCGAEADRCEAHHIRHWEFWGNTDIENLVLVCTRCHHDLHDRGMVLRRSEGRWRIVSRDGPAPPAGRGSGDQEVDEQLWLIA